MNKIIRCMLFFIKDYLEEKVILTNEMKQFIIDEVKKIKED